MNHPSDRRWSRTQWVVFLGLLALAIVSCLGILANLRKQEFQSLRADTLSIDIIDDARIHRFVDSETGNVCYLAVSRTTKRAVGISCVGQVAQAPLKSL